MFLLSLLLTSAAAGSNNVEPFWGGARDSLITDFKLLTQLKMTLNSPTYLPRLSTPPPECWHY